MKIVFFGTPEISKIFLEHIIKTQEIIGVVTAPDRRAGRGLTLFSSPVKEVALKNNLKVFTPENLKFPDFISQLSALGAQLFLVVSYGKIIPREVFPLPRYGTVNIHFSLLPKYRGAAPIQWSLIKGEKKTGVSLFFINEGMDTGPVISQAAAEILDEDDANTLQEKLVQKAKSLLDAMLSEFKSGKITSVSQYGEPSFAPMLTKSDGRINWNNSARDILNLIRGVINWPTAYTTAPSGKSLKIFSAAAIDFNSDAALPGMITGLVKNRGFVVKCGKGFIEIKEVQPENKKRMSAWDYCCGARLSVGDILR